MTIKERMKKIKFIILDVDGVLTDGRIVYDNKGNELKFFDVQDGLGIAVWRKAGYKCGIITAKQTNIVAKRAHEIGLDCVYQNHFDKTKMFAKILKDFNLKKDQVCYIGDDLVDLAVLVQVGFAVAVPNACKEVKKAAHYITKKTGGRGAVREVIEKLLNAKGEWNRLVKKIFMASNK